MKTQLRIAVADREPDMRHFLYRALTRDGHLVVTVAGSGHELIDDCRRYLPDLVITDVEIPAPDGLTALHSICETAPVPAIVISAQSDPEILRRASKELVFAFLVKPIKMDDLQPAIWITMQRYAERSQAKMCSTTDFTLFGNGAETA